MMFLGAVQHQPPSALILGTWILARRFNVRLAINGWERLTARLLRIPPNPNPPTDAGIALARERIAMRFQVPAARTVVTCPTTKTSAEPASHEIRDQIQSAGEDYFEEGGGD